MPTAFVCHCDMAAHYLLATLNEHGYRCPEDVSIMSFDNTRLAETCCPPLTSVDIEPRAFVRLALDLLTNEELRSANTRFYLSASLVERQSAGPAKEA
jgi:LacI family transcriptional regulator